VKLVGRNGIDGESKVCLSIKRLKEGAIRDLSALMLILQRDIEKLYCLFGCN